MASEQKVTCLEGHMFYFYKVGNLFSEQPVQKIWSIEQLSFFHFHPTKFNLQYNPSQHSWGA